MQLGNITEHLEKVAQDLMHLIPDSTFNGLAIIDWEAWRPLFDRNYDSFKPYQELSIEKVQQEHPEWERKAIVAEAKREFEHAAS